MITNKTIKTFGGMSSYFTHASKTTNTRMNFSVYCGSKTPRNAIIWLSGLTCTEDNFITKSGVQNILKDTETMIICPDTSPRGLDLPGEHEDYDFGSGAGFYVNATTEQYRNHYQMYDYIKNDIVAILKDNYNITSISIMGHSMGGHGALILGLREPQLFKSISAFAPIVNPLACPWGEKAFEGYFGGDRGIQAPNFDAVELLKSGRRHQNLILIEQGLDDEFLKDQLEPKSFTDICDEVGQPYKINLREGYDHSYFFISSFLKEHIDHHISLLEQ